MLVSWTLLFGNSLYIGGLYHIKCQAITRPIADLLPQEHTSVEFGSKYKNFHSTKYIWKCFLQNGSHSVLTSMRALLASNVTYWCHITNLHFRKELKWSSLLQVISSSPMGNLIYQSRTNFITQNSIGHRISPCHFLLNITCVWKDPISLDRRWCL